jgi:hypothetical protein
MMEQITESYCKMKFQACLDFLTSLQGALAHLGRSVHGRFYQPTPGFSGGNRHANLLIAIVARVAEWQTLRT